MNDFQRFITKCSECGENTSKKYARTHDGKCKPCATGTERVYNGPKCPQCGRPISAFKKARHYVCEACTRLNDPVGYANEVRGLYD